MLGASILQTTRLNDDEAIAIGASHYRARTPIALGGPRPSSRPCKGVTEGAVKLQKAGLIKYARGHITVLDRPGLEARSCECYAVVKNEYDRLLPAIMTK